MQGQADVYTNKANNKKYRVLKKLGQGAFGKVELCELLNPVYERDIKSYTPEEQIKKKFVAMKSIKNVVPEKGLEFNAQREIAILKEVKHENIIKLEDVFADDKSKFTYVAMEYMTCDLAVLIDKKRINLMDGDIKFIFRQICKGVQALHDNWVLHRVIFGLIIKGHKAAQYNGLDRWIHKNNRFWTGKVC